MKFSDPSWFLAERSPSRLVEFRRKVVRRWRKVPDLGALRDAGMVIGTNVNAMNGVHLDPGRPWLLTIGDDVTMSLDVVVLTHDASMLMHVGGTLISPVRIGSRVFIGAHAVVLPGVTIGDDVVVAAGAVVAHDVPSGSVVAGVPARVLSSLEDWTAKQQIAIAASPTWTSGELPTGSIPTDLQTAALEKLRVSRVGFVGVKRSQHPER